MTTFVDRSEAVELDLENLDIALTRLATVSAERARLVELRFFVGLTIEESGKVLGISSATVKRQWDVARAWIVREIAQRASASTR